MSYLHYDMNLEPDDIVKVSLDNQANVRLLDDQNFTLYKDGKHHRYIGGLATKSPVRLRPPHSGHWHVVIDLGGYGGRVRASVTAEKAH